MPDTSNLQRLTPLPMRDHAVPDPAAQDYEPLVAESDANPMVRHPMDSQVCSYSRAFPARFDRAEGAFLYTTSGRGYLDFFCGAGAMNYGHNPPELLNAASAYIARKGILHGMDMMTEAKWDFLNAMSDIVLKPRGMNYIAQFSGPTGTNAVEAALKLARKVTQRQNVVAFSNSFHGVTTGSLAVTASTTKRSGTILPLPHAYFFSYEGFGGATDPLERLETAFELAGSGFDLPAAVIIETVQGEGGINLASAEFLQSVSAFCKRNGILLIVDDIQMACGRTGDFFSFDGMGIEPDIICLSKSLSGVGLPLSMVLLKPELDVWRPGEHAGTFRGNNLAFVTAAEALRTYWIGDMHKAHIQRVGEIIQTWAQRLQAGGVFPIVDMRGRGAVWGIELADGVLAGRVSHACFKRGVMIDTCGPHGAVLKLMPPTVIPFDALSDGLSRIENALCEVCQTP